MAVELKWMTPEATALALPITEVFLDDAPVFVTKINDFTSLAGWLVLPVTVRLESVSIELIERLLLIAALAVLHMNLPVQ